MGGFADALSAFRGASLGEAVSVMPTVLLFTAGAFVLPPLLQRAYAAPYASQAASATLWSLLFVIALAAGAFLLVDGLAAAAASPAANVDLLSWSASLFAVLPAILAALVLAGLFAALLSLAQAALFAGAAALSRDAWRAFVIRRGREGRRVFAARMVVLALAAGGAALAAQWPLGSPETMAWAFAIAVAGSLAPLVAGLYWKKCSAIGALWGTLVGVGVICLTLAATLSLLPDWIATRPVGPSAAAAIGAIASTIVTIGASLVESMRAEGNAAAPARDSSPGGRLTLPVRLVLKIPAHLADHVEEARHDPIGKNGNPVHRLRVAEQNAALLDRRNARFECGELPGEVRCRRAGGVLGNGRARIGAASSGAKRDGAGYSVETEGSGFDRGRT